MKKKLLFIITPLIIMGCATGKNHQAKHKPKLHKESLKYMNGMSTTSKSRTKGTCPSSLKALNKMSWQQVLVATNACIRVSRWQRVEQIGNHLAKTTHLSPWGSYYLSLAALQRKDFPRALWMIELSSKKAKPSGILLFQKARIFWGMKQYAAAVRLTEEALELDSNMESAHLFLGQVYLRDSDPSKAKEHFQQVLITNSKSFAAFFGLGESEAQLKNFKESVSYFSQAIELKPYQLHLHMRQAYVYESLLKDLQKALRSYKTIRRYVSQRKMSRPAQVNLDQKIITLEKELLKKTQPNKVSMRKPAEQEVK